MGSRALRSAAIIGAAFLVSIVFASTSYADAGDIVRKGRFVWHKVSDDLDPTRGNTATKANDSPVVYDKGELGKYVRNGRFVSKVYKGDAVPSSSMLRRDYEPTRNHVLDHYKHKHYLP